ncbi:bacterio-opsin activator domain-containing protein [Natribaculum luteum]|uniref:Bacterio-opsin activator domain-containing protein n=1 Tax=Natribaculum luteum TaxID=1586232 RepID=A0ABD5P1R5_9EURY|nr:bacterio-opsin activator domain-containing protein [Natribaculum luteum]
MSGSRPVAVGDVVRVLVVGDSTRTDDATATLEAAFSGPSVLTARTTTTALDRLADEDVHCVVCDLESDAAETATVETIREQVPDLPVLALVDDGAADALEAGATDVLSSDDPPAVVAARVRHAVERFRLSSRATEGGRYRAVLDASNALVVVVDEDGDVAYASPSIESETGYTPDDLERGDLSRFVHPNDREDVSEMVAEVTSGSLGATARSTARIARVDGTWYVSDVTVTNRLDDPAVEGVVVTITPTELTEAADERLQAAIDRLDRPFFALGSNWELTEVNEVARRLFDQPVGELVGTVVWELLPESVAGTFYERFHEAQTTDDVVEFETAYPPLETRLEVTVYPSESGVTVSAREVAAGEGRDRLDLFESVVDALEDGVFVVEGTAISLANAAVFDLVDADTVVGRDLADLFDDDLAESIHERALSPVRLGEPIETTISDERPVAISVTPLPEADRAVCVIRDATDRVAVRAALSTIREFRGVLVDAESRPEIYQAVVDAVAEVLAVDVVGGYLRDDDSLKPTTFATPGVDESSALELPTLEVGETALAEAFETGDASVHDRSALESLFDGVGVRAERVLVVPVGDDGVVIATTTDPTAFGDREVEFVETVAVLAAVTVTRLERERDLSRQSARLDRLAAIDERKRAITRRLVRADTREEIERFVCKELAAIDWLALVWIGEVDVATETVSPRAWAGEADDYLEAITVDLDQDGEPAGRVAATRDVIEIENVVGEDRNLEWRRAALDREFGSVLGVPLAYDGSIYGTLTAYADRPAVFDGTRDAFVELGETIAYAINAVETRRALLVDGVTELELAIDDEDDPLAALTRRVDCTLELETVVPLSSNRATVFATVSDAPADAVRDAAVDLESVASVRSIAERDDESLFELTLEAETIATTVADHGGVVRSVSAAAERTRLVVELPRGADVRAFVQRLRRDRPTELLVRHERDRSTWTRRAFRDELRDRLTDQQLQALEAAYYGGFFEWPRESTGEEIASSLGVSQPTFNRHFRTAERKLYTLLFDEGTVGSDRE